MKQRMFRRAFMLLKDNAELRFLPAQISQDDNPTEKSVEMVRNPTLYRIP